MPAEAHPIRGYLAIAAAAFFWGGAATLGKAVFTGRLIGGAVTSIDPLILAQTRTTFSFLVLLPLMLGVKGPGSLSMPRADVLRCFVMGVVGVAASNYFYYLAIQKTTVATAIIIQYTAPVLVLLYMVARRLQRATVQRVLGVAAAMAGVVLVIGLVGHGHIKLDPVGVIVAEAAAFSFAFYNVFGHKLVTRFDPWRVLTFVLLGSTLFWLFVNPPWKVAAAHYSGAQWGFLFVFACISVLVPFALYFTGLRFLDATRAIVTSCLEPVFAILFAALFVGERLSWIQIIGVLLVVAATVIVQLPERKGAEPPTDATLAMAE